LWMDFKLSKKYVAPRTSLHDLEADEACAGQLQKIP